MSLPKIIGLSGRIGCGKDTAAEWLSASVETNYTIARFSYWLKLMLASAFSEAGYKVSVPHLNDAEFKKQEIPGMGTTWRDAMISLGTEWGRDMVHPDIWVKMTKHAMLSSFDKYGNAVRFVIPDVRFENEAEMIKSLGGKIINITRPSTDDEAPRAEHASEAGIPSHYVDSVVSNDGTVWDLHIRIVRAVRRLGKE